WREADAYARAVKGGLPTEAQWEYAARSQGKDHRYVWGNVPPTEDDKKKANIYSDEAEPSRRFPRDRTKQGIFDLEGNLKEWCRDVWEPYDAKAQADTQIDPQGPRAGNGPVTYVIRGNSYDGDIDRCGTTRRDDPEPADQRAKPLGFRLVI